MNWTRWACVALLACVLGCGGGHGSFSQPSPAHGKVTLLKGLPARHVRVVFIPTDGRGKHVEADTDAQGGFVLSTFAPRDGAVPGHYIVTIESLSRASPKIARKYESSDSSDLRVEIKPGQDNRIELKLNS